MTYYVVSLAVSFGWIVASLLIVQQSSVFVQTSWSRGKFDPTTVLQAVRTGGSMMVGAVLVVLALVCHWRVVHGRVDWNWPLILGHWDGACVEMVGEAASGQPSAVSQTQGDPVLGECVERCTAFCLENDD